jgi:hypothetical protein
MRAKQWRRRRCSTAGGLSLSPVTRPSRATPAARVPGQRRDGDGDGRARANARRDAHLPAERAGGVAHAATAASYVYPAAAPRASRAANHAARREGRAGCREEEALRRGVEEGHQLQLQRADRGGGAHGTQVQRRRRADGRDRAGHHEVPARAHLNGSVCPWCLFGAALKLSSFVSWVFGGEHGSIPRLQDLLDPLILPWWLPVVLHFYFLLKCEGESFFIRRDLLYPHSASYYVSFLDVTYGGFFKALLTVASEKYNGLQWPHLASGGSLYSAPVGGGSRR